jgi:DNA repair protein RecO (recombination protein O)
MKADLAIVLRSSLYQERDKLVYLLTEHHGKITGIAKGAVHSRRFGGAFDLFNCINVEFVDKPERELARIDSATVKRDFPALRLSLEKISAAGYFLDLVNRLLEPRHPSREIFILLAHYLHLLETAQATTEVVRSFEIKLVDRLGYSPIFQQCVSCGVGMMDYFKDERLASFSFSIERGGILCPNCASASEGRRISREAALWVQLVRSTPIKEIPTIDIGKAAVSEGADFLKDFIRYHGPGLDRASFRSQNFLEQVLTY